MSAAVNIEVDPQYSVGPMTNIEKLQPFLKSGEYRHFINYLYPSSKGVY